MSIVKYEGAEVVETGLPHNVTWQAIDSESNLTEYQQANLFVFFTGINLHYLLNDLGRIQRNEISYCNSDIYKMRPCHSEIWDLVESQLTDIISYARFCIDKTDFFPPFWRQRFIDEQ
jgi:hypothetical protein